MIAGLFILLAAGLLQGLFVLPLSFTKNWKWEHNWFMFSLLGMIVLNWILAFILFPNLFTIYSQVPLSELLLLSVFGLLWGIGAILFGLGMERLGLSVGYPIIMGLIAGAGTLLPLILSKPESILTWRGAGIIAGCILVITGIFISSKANTLKQDSADNVPGKKPAFTSGIMIAIAAGLLSALPNIGMTFATQTISKAIASGIKPAMAGNLVWLLFFTVGFIANAVYTLYLINKGHSFKQFKSSFNGRNVCFTLLSAACWIGSFYLYGSSANSMGSFGNIIAWPLFIALAIITGNISGIWKGEWKGATKKINPGAAVWLGCFFSCRNSAWPQ